MGIRMHCNLCRLFEAGVPPCIAVMTCSEAARTNAAGANGQALVEYVIATKFRTIPQFLRDIGADWLAKKVEARIAADPNSGVMAAPLMGSQIHWRPKSLRDAEWFRRRGESGRAG